MGEVIGLTASDGHEFGAWLATPEGKPRGGLIVGMEMYGVNDYLKGVCDDFAAEGYLTIAPRLFDRFEPDLTNPYDDVGSRRGKELSAIIDHDQTMLDVTAAMERVRPAGKVAIMGFCFGGTVTWLAACRCDLDAGIAYYGSNMCDYPDEQPKCPVICHVGDLDTAVPPAHVASFQEKHPAVHWNIYSGAQHGFDNSTRTVRYHAAAAAQARQRSLAFLRDRIG
ncbi:MAG: dienelactone hydrolase family protein [Proteobacteria bacterium]|nr:dienelactone hydrolase family protein [Pseudomonadota bacterium]MDA1325905.1 dienelactone hydrolase family protein [Pseudomonadota bacterium]